MGRSLHSHDGNATKPGRWFARGMRAAIVAIAALSGFSCQQSSEAYRTTPPNGAQNVDPTTKITVVFSSAMDATTVTSDSFVVTGNIHPAAYTGTIAADETNRIFTFTLGASGTSGTAGATTTRTEFYPGETILVHLTTRITGVNGIPYEGMSFSFTIRGESSEAAADQIAIVSATPANADPAVSPLPVVRVSFDQAAVQSGLSSGVKVRGSQSGTHAGALSYAEAASSTTAAYKTVAFQLADGDSFLPGETVVVSLSDKIAPTSGVGLSPREIRFAIASAAVGTARWDGADALGAVPAEVLGLAAGEFADIDGGPHILAWNREQVVVVTDAGSDPRLVASVGPFAASAKDVVAADLDDDGYLEIAVLVDLGTTCRVYLLDLTSSGTLVPATSILPDDETSYSLSLSGAARLAVADFDSDGYPDIAIAHGQGVAVLEGNLSLVGDTTGILGDLLGDLGQSTEAYTLVSNVATGAGAVRDLFVPGDVTGDGKPDIIARTAQGAKLLKNMGSGRFLVSSYVLSAGGKAISEGPLASADLDDDGVHDLIAVLEGSGLPQLAVFSGGRGTGRLGETTAAVARILTGSAGGTSASAGAVIAGDLDGDAEPEVAYALADGSRWVLAEIGTGATYDPIPFDLTPALAALAPATAIVAADVTGDGALEVFVADGPSGVARFTASQAGAAPLAENAFAIPADRVTKDASGTTLVVTGRIGTRASGLTLGLDYDETLLALDAVDFVSGSGIYENTAEFTVCGLSGSSCAGRAIVTLTFTNGPFRSLDFVPILAFRFREIVVPEEVTRTEVNLEHGLKDAAGTAVDTAILAVVNSSASVSVRADIAAASYEIVMRPPSLVISACEVGPGATGRVSWTAEGGASFDRFEVVSEYGSVRSVLAVLPGTATELDAIALSHGTTTITVAGYETSGLVSSPTCTMTYVTPPELDAPVLETSAYRLTWQMATGLEVDGFRIYVDGTRVSSTSDETLTYAWTKPTNDPGTHLFEVRAVLGDAESEAGHESSTELYDGAGGQVSPPKNLAARAVTGDPSAVQLTWKNGQGYTSIRILRDGVEIAGALAGGTVAYVDRNVPPGTHTWQVVGRVSTLESDPNQAQATLQVALIGPSSLACAIAGRDPGDGMSLVDLAWENGYAYDSLRLERVHGGQTETITVDPGATAFTDRLAAPSGTYEYRLRGIFSGNESPAAACTVEFSSALWLVDYPTGVGLERIRIPIHAKAVDRIIGLSFVFHYDAARLVIDTNPVNSVLPATAGAQVEALAGNAAGALAVRVTGLDVGPGSDVIACEILAATHPNHALYGYQVTTLDVTAAQIPVSLTDGVIAYDGGDSPVDATSAIVDVFGRFVLVQAEDASGVPLSEVAAGQSYVAAVYASHDFPMESLEVTIEFDPALSRCVQINRGADVPAEGLFLSNKDDVVGLGHLGWFRPFTELGEPTGTLIQPGVNRRLARLQMLALEPGAGIDVVLPLVVGSQTSLFPILGTYPARRPGDETGTGPKTAHEFVVDGEILIRSSVVLPPVLETLTPTSGAQAGGTQVQAKGQHFTQDAKIVIGGVELQPTYVDSQTLLFSTPAGTGQVQVFVRTAGGDSASLPFQYTAPAPQITSITPVSGPEEGGTVVTIAGLYFTSDAEVFVASVKVAAQFIDAQTLRVVMPAGTGRVAISVTTPWGTATRADAYEYLLVIPPAQIDSFEPTHGPSIGGTTVTIHGSGFVQATQVRIGPDYLDPGTVTFVDSGTLQALTPGGTGQVEVAVRNPSMDEVVAVSLFTYEALTITALTPATGVTCGGTVVDVSGTGFGEDLVVEIDGRTAQVLSVDVSGNRATIVVPEAPEGTGAVAVVVRSGGSEATLPSGFEYSDPGLPFTRGDVNSDGRVDVADVAELARYALGGGEINAQPDAADANDDGVIHVGDVIYLSNYVFSGGAEPPAPFPAPGFDPTPDEIRSCRAP
ncbi:MAG: IPT/TIG domain-containing protein [Planctomycetes bacterium]|nr:IPT/TIG domain-containing protein [Planctomycetota bacterium]